MSVNSFSRVYSAANPVFTGTIVGKVGTDTFTVTYSTVATKTSPAGMYPITATVTGQQGVKLHHYHCSGTLTITPAPLTITIAKATSTYGAAIPAFAYTATGFVNGDTAATAFTGAPQPDHYRHATVADRNLPDQWLHRNACLDQLHLQVRGQYAHHR